MPITERHVPVMEKYLTGQRGEGFIENSADALPWMRPCDTAYKYAGDRGTERM